MKLLWEDTAWVEYLHWQSTDKAILKRINKIIKDMKRNPFSGIGKPEPLQYNFANYWSRRITQEHRIIYKVDNNIITIAQCRYHYKK